MPDENGNEGGGASQTTDPAYGSSSATDVSLREYAALDQRWMWRFLEERDRRYEERDRRYTEVQRERDKAEVIARDTQTYKDRQGNELREQLGRERLDYASKSDLTGALETINATLKPLVEYVAAQQGSRQGAFDQRTLVSWFIGIVGGGFGIWAIIQATGAG